MAHSACPPQRRLAHLCWLLVLIPWMSACQVATIRPLDASGAPPPVMGGAVAFDAEAFVESIWASQILPAAAQDSTDLATVIAAIAADREAAEAQYGQREQGRPASFLVQGEGRVLEVDTSSRNGKLMLDLPPFDQQPDVALQIGPVLRGTAVRDAVGFIHFNQFVNQLEYAAVANALNDRVAADVLAPLDPTTLADQMVRFQGAFTLTDPAALVIMPLKLELGDQP